MQGYENINENTVSIIQTGIDETQITDLTKEAEITHNTEIEMTNRDELEIQQLEQKIDKQNEETIDINKKEDEQQIIQNSNTTLSSTLLNNILKQISLDSQTDQHTKTKIVNAILLTVLNEEQIPETTQSPNKEALEKIFGVNTTPEKKRKVVIPRLKQSAFGEVLTSQEVKERLKEAEEKKKTEEKESNTEKMQEYTKGK